MADAISERRATVSKFASRPDQQAPFRRSQTMSDLPILKEENILPKINIEFGASQSKRRIARVDGLDIGDASYKINSFLNQYPCLFSRGLPCKQNSIKSNLDTLSMECSIIPLRCRGPYYNLIGYFYSILDKQDKADSFFDMALKLNPDDVIANVNKARCYLKQNDILRTHPILRRIKEIQSRSTHMPGGTPLSTAQNTIAFAYNKLGLSCAALKHYDSALKSDPLNYDVYLGKGEVLVRMSKHEGRANALEELEEGITCLRKYIGEYNVLNLARGKDPRESPLPRDTKAVNNVFAVILLTRALNERSRRLDREYSTEAIEYMDLILQHSERSVFVLYQLGDEKGLMNELEGETGALKLLKDAIDMRDNYHVYQSYALAIQKWEKQRYQERFRVVSNMTASSNLLDHDTENDPQCRQDHRKKSVKQQSSKSNKGKPFVFEGDNELREGLVKVAKLMKHALKLSHNEDTPIALHLADIYCSLNRKSDAEVMFETVLKQSSNAVEREMAYRKFSMFLIKTGNFPKGDEMMERALKMREQVHHNEQTIQQLEETINILVEYSKNENGGREKFWLEQLALMNPNYLEDHMKPGSKSSKARNK